MTSEPVGIILRVIQELDRLGVPYLIGGSFASAMYGEPRATLDADIIADLGTEHAVPLERALSGEFYIAREAVREAIRTRSRASSAQSSARIVSRNFALAEVKNERPNCTNTKQSHADHATYAASWLGFWLSKNSQ